MSHAITAVPVGHSLRRLYLIRAGAAVAWAAAVAALGPDSTASLWLLVAYPLIDVVASLVDAAGAKRAGADADARTQQINAVVSSATAAAIAAAAGLSGTTAAVVVFGVWAGVAGLVQLVLGLRRRRALGGQWLMIISGAGSTIAGISFIVTAGRPDFELTQLAGYAVVGALLFVVSALRLRRSS